MKIKLNWDDTRDLELITTESLKDQTIQEPPINWNLEKYNKSIGE